MTIKKLDENTIEISNPGDVPFEVKKDALQAEKNRIENILKEFDQIRRTTKDETMWIFEKSNKSQIKNLWDVFFGSFKMWERT